MWVPKVRYFESTKFIWNAAWRWKQFICPSMWAKTLVCPYSGLPLFSIFESPIIHSVCPSPHSPPKWEDCIFHFLRACENNNLSRIWGTNRVYYGLFENSQWFLCWQRSRSRREKNEKNYVCKFPWLAGWWCGAGLTNSLFPFPLPTHGDYNYFHDDRHGNLSARFVERGSGLPSTSLRSLSTLATPLVASLL